MTFRILLTGSRLWLDRPAIIRGLCDSLRNSPEDEPAVLVHGAAVGADSIAHSIWCGWGQAWGTDLYLPPEKYTSKDFQTPLERNKYMVSLGADVCVVFAMKWSSGSGHCARLARAVKIPVLDFGVSTAYSDRAVL
jgi:hypothetical protein